MEKLGSQPEKHEIIDFAGRTYDPGLVPEVVEVRQDETLPEGHAAANPQAPLSLR